MQQKSEGLHLPLLLLLLLLVLLFQPLTLDDLEEVDKMPVEVIVDSSPCSATCGLGLKTQTVCLMTDSAMVMEEDASSSSRTGVSEKCRVRKVKCQESWQCGLRTMTATSGQRVEIDCLGEVMEAMGRFSWRVLWRYARGIISSDDSLFDRYEALHLDRVILDPVREEDAGTYRCDVQDPMFRRVKRVYWGVRVLPAGILSLDYESSLANWELNQQNQTVTGQHADSVFVFYVIVVLVLLVVAILFMRVGRIQRRADAF